MDEQKSAVFGSQRFFALSLNLNSDTALLQLAWLLLHSLGTL
ncbi:hypothetical protein COO91_08250 [Nostoc flagelliforme CCNUN1]|uniref:Uncharacterized protein n=1 Tax=Nostoc flagelliforme CCNUN1 TaxID=2038116 RepID=A0A2K8T3H8_9NOSO|nr:hypothetical protein COO91_08250 [Nostoc flagelliforme CCNUN1]